MRLKKRLKNEVAGDTRSKSLLQIGGTGSKRSIVALKKSNTKRAMIQVQAHVPVGIRIGIKELY